MLTVEEQHEVLEQLRAVLAISAQQAAAAGRGVDVAIMLAQRCENAKRELLETINRHTDWGQSIA